MKSHPSSPTPFDAEGTRGLEPGNHAPARPTDALQRPRRPRAPQFGSDRRGQRTRDATRSLPLQVAVAPGHAPETVLDDNRGNRERRKGIADRRQSWQSKEAHR